MILEIRQTATSGTNQFEITSGGRLLYRADASWMPLGVNATNKLHLLDGAGNPCFETRYSLLENLQESWLPYKYLFTGSQKFSRYEVLDANGGYAGCFFREATDLAPAISAWNTAVRYWWATSKIGVPGSMSASMTAKPRWDS